MAGNLEGVFAVDYRPLVATDGQKPEEADLSFDIEELGTYRYRHFFRDLVTTLLTVLGLLG